MEALMGVFLAMIRWHDAPQAIELWAVKRTIRDKLEAVRAQADLTGPVHQKMVVLVLDAFSSLSKKRNKLAHGFFGIITDRENQFAWREGAQCRSEPPDADLGRKTDGGRSCFSNYHCTPFA
jgi:hypothetical protein